MSDSLSHHPEPSPLSSLSSSTKVRLSAEQGALLYINGFVSFLTPFFQCSALTRVSGLDEQKRARYGHRHTNSLGLLSPKVTSSYEQQQQQQISSPPSSSTASSSTSSLSFFSSSSSLSESQHHLPHTHNPFSSLNTQITHTPPSPRPRTPRTPLRSSTTPQFHPHNVHTSPRASPLFQRLLEPFAKSVSTLTSSPTSTTTPSATPTTFSFLLPSFNSSNMYQSPPSPTYTHQQYTASRSERLLRDALIRDERERSTGTAASSSSSSISPNTIATSSVSGSASSTSPRTHRRRHSHIPTSSIANNMTTTVSPLTSSPTPLSPPLSAFSPSPNPNNAATAVPPSLAAATAGTQKDRRRRSLNTPSAYAKQQEEELTRGSFLFRTAMSNPRSMSPGASSLSGSASGSRSREDEQRSVRSTSKSNDSRNPYGGDVEVDIESRAILPSTPLQRNAWRRPNEQQEPQYQLTHSRSRSAYTTSASSPRSTSHSPSPLRRQTQRQSSLQRQQRPSPLPLSNDVNVKFTPDRNVAPNTPNSASLQRHHTIHSSPSYRRNGGEIGVTTPETTPSKRAAGTRAGSRPPPIDLYNHHQQLNSPRRGQQQQVQSYHQSQGLNPMSPGEPLIMTPHEQVLRARLERVLEAGKVVERKEREKRRRSESRGGTVNEVRDEEGDWPWREKEQRGRAMNNDPTGSPRMVHDGHSRTRSKTDSVLPSLLSATGMLLPTTPRRATTAPAAPTSLSPSKISVRPETRTGTTPPLEGGEDGDEEGEEGDLRLITPPPTPPFTARIFSVAGANGEYCPSPYKTTYAANVTAPPRGGKLGGLGAIRRPKHAPRQQDQQDDDDSISSCSSSNSQGSSAHQHQRRGRQHPFSSSASSHGDNDINTPPSPTPFSHRPHFNARKASARCRAIEGYVSFASVEGLGEPPADPLSPHDDDSDGRHGGKRDARGMLLSMGNWGGWTKRLLGVRAGHVRDGDDPAGVVL